jgi:hypothetical protein
VIEAVIILAAGIAAAYLMYPLIRRGGRRLVVLAALLVAAQGVAAAAEGSPSIGLLLIAVDVQRDYLRVSEALRVVNGGPPRKLDLVVTLPAGAVYFTVHRGLWAPSLEESRFRGRLTIPRGISEFAYSYALPARSTEVLIRTFPLRVRRLEMVIRGRGAGLTASRGRTVEPLELGGEHLPRWEVRELDAGEPVRFFLTGLPVTRRWLPPAAAGAFALLLSGGFLAALKIRAPAEGEKVEESPPVRRN